MAPSPTAVAIWRRSFWRTSPMAKMPAYDVDHAIVCYHPTSVICDTKVSYHACYWINSNVDKDATKFVFAKLTSFNIFNRYTRNLNIRSFDFFDNRIPDKVDLSLAKAQSCKIF